MQAVVLHSFDAPPELRDVPAPTPGDEELLVRVQASAANPVDNAVVAGHLQGVLEHALPVVLGRDYAGVVEAVGRGVTRFAPGDDVFGFVLLANPGVSNGSWAEQVVLAEDVQVARRPAGVDVAAAGAASLAGVTAITALDALGLEPGTTVLVVGASGGVGSLAVQLAVAAGATVLAPGLPEDEAYLRGLGVREVLDRGGDVAAAVRERVPGGVDGLLDLVSGSPDAVDAYAAALAPLGRVASPLSAAGDAAGRVNVFAQPSPDNLNRLARALEQGLRVPIQRSYELAEAPAALRALASEHVQGKLGVRVA